MEKYFLFLKKPFSFQGRFNRIQYCISILLSLFISLILVIILAIIVNNFPKPSSLEAAESSLEAARDLYYSNGTDNAQYNEKHFERCGQYVRDEEEKYRDNKEIFVVIYILITSIPVLLFLVASGTKRSHDIGDSGKLQLVLPFYIWVLIFKNSEKSNNLYGEYIVPDKVKKENDDNLDILVAEFCPQCKNPNTQKLKICEWCGGQIV